MNRHFRSTCSQHETERSESLCLRVGVHHVDEALKGRDLLPVHPHVLAGHNTFAALLFAATGRWSRVKSIAKRVAAGGWSCSHFRSQCKEIYYHSCICDADLTYLIIPGCRSFVLRFI